MRPAQWSKSGLFNTVLVERFGEQIGRFLTQILEEGDFSEQYFNTKHAVAVNCPMQSIALSNTKLS